MRRHLLALAAALALALLVSERSTGFSVDEGSYAIQAEAADRSGWELRWPFRPFDPEGEHFPYHGGAVTDGDEPAEYAYTSHPAWPWALSLVDGIGGQEVGLRLLSLGSVLLAAACAWGIGARLGAPAIAPWAFWVVGTSPVLPNGLMTWAHAPAAALSGLAVLAAVVLAAGRSRWWWWVALPVAVAGGVLIRSEGLFAGLALGGVVGGLGLLRRDRRSIAAGLVTGASVGAALLGERAWIESVTHGGRSSNLVTRAGDGGGWVDGRLRGAGTVLLAAVDDPAGAACGLAAVALVLSAVVLSRHGRLPVVPALLVVAAAALVVQALVVPDRPVHGLVLAWPVVVLAAGAVGRVRGSGLAHALLAGCGAFSLAVIATQYSDGGGLQWGGRYLAPLLVPLGAVAAAGLVAVLPPGTGRRAGAVLLGATAGLGLVVTDEVRSGNAEAVALIAATGEPVVLVGDDQLGRLDWGGWPDERCWISGEGDLRGAIAVLRAAGVRRAAYVGIAPPALERAGLAVTPGELPQIGTIDLGPSTERAFAGCGRRVA